MRYISDSSLTCMITLKKILEKMDRIDINQAKARGAGHNVTLHDMAVPFSSFAFICSSLTAWFDGLSQP